jgi:hypothetical protein
MVVPRMRAISGRCGALVVSVSVLMLFVRMFVHNGYPGNFIIMS